MANFFSVLFKENLLVYELKLEREYVEKPQKYKKRLLLKMSMNFLGTLPA